MLLALSLSGRATSASAGTGNKKDRALIGSCQTMCILRLTGVVKDFDCSYGDIERLHH